MKQLMMHVKNHLLLRELFAAVIPPLIALTLQWVLWKIIDPYVWFLFYPAVFFSSWVGTFRSCLFSAVLSTSLVWWFFVPPTHSVMKEAKQLFPALIFLSVGIIFAIFQERLRRANERAALLLAEKERTREKLRGEQALREREKILSLFIEHAPVAVAMLDKNMCYLAASKRWRADLAMGDQNFVGRSHYELFPNIPERWKVIHRRCLSGEVIRADEDLWERADGSNQWLRWEVRPWDKMDGLIGGMMIFMEDITNLKESEEIKHLYEKAKEVDRLKNEFFANVGHELRTPLTLIIGPITNLLDMPLPENVQNQLRSVKRNARGLLKLVNDLLDIAKFEAGKLTGHYVEADLAHLLRQIVSHFDSAAKVKGFNFVVNSPTSMPIQIDVEKFERILMNLLSNAFKFTPQGGTIRCQLKMTKDNKALIEVADSGPGVPEKFRGAIFDRFYQIESSSNRRFNGTGLGLAIVKDFTEILQGKVKADTAEEGGALFSVELPLKAPRNVQIHLHRQAEALTEKVVLQELDRTQSSQVSRAVKVKTNGPRKLMILVVEDNPDMVQYVCETLGSSYDLESAENGRVGLEKAITLKPDLILSDMMMPEMSGDQMFREIRKNPLLKDIPFIMLTAKADDDLRMELLKEGAQDYLIKPFIPQELIARVRNIMAVKASEAKYRGLLSTAQDAIIIVDGAGKIEFVNEQVLNWFGYKIEDLHGRPIEILVPEAIRRTHVKQRDDYLAHPKRRPMGRPGLDLKARRKDGSLLPVDIALSPLQTPEGLKVTAIIRDMSEREKRESQTRFLASASRALAESLEFEDTLNMTASLAVPEISDGCVVRLFGDDGKLHPKVIVHRNPEKQKNLENLVNSLDFRDVITKPITVALETKRVQIIQVASETDPVGIRLIPSEQDSLDYLGIFSCAILPLIFHGQLLGEISFISDESRRRFEESDRIFLESIGRRVSLSIENARLFRESQKEIKIREDILGIVSHDLKNPLSAIGLVAQLLLRLKSDGETKVPELAGKIQRSVAQMQEMIGNLLDFAKTRREALN